MKIPYLTFLKHAQKVTKDAPKSRPILKGVLHKSDGSLVVTDSYRLYHAKNTHTNTFDSVIDPKTGEQIDGTYPNIEPLLSNNENAKYSVNIPVDEAVKAFKALSAVNKADKEFSQTATAEVVETNKLVFFAKNTFISTEYRVSTPVYGEGDKMVFNTQYFVEALALFKDVRASEITFRYYGSTRPFTISYGENDELLVLILPIRVHFGDKEDGVV